MIKAGPSMHQYSPSASSEDLTHAPSLTQHDVVINVPLSQSGCTEVQLHEFDGLRMPYVPASVKEDRLRRHNVWNAFRVPWDECIFLCHTIWQ